MKNALYSLFGIASFAIMTTFSSPASASCTTNPAICKEICGCSCCTTKTGCGGGSGGFAIKTGRDATAALKNFSTKSLKREMATIKNDAKVKRLLATEIKRRN